MSKALSRFSEQEREGVAKRRLLHKTGGLGYLSARDYLESRKKGNKKR